MNAIVLQACPDCGERSCFDELCDRGCDRHAYNRVELPSGAVRFVCDRCIEIVECENGCKGPRWSMTTLDGDRFCPRCCHIAPGEIW